MRSLSERLSFRIHTVSPEVLRDVARIDELRGSWIAGVRLHAQTLVSLKASALITSSGASTRIEGSQLSDRDIEALMRGISIGTLRDRDAQEVRGYHELLENILESFSQIPINENVIKHFHKMMLQHVEKDSIHRGEYKRIENTVRMVDAMGTPGEVIFQTAPVYLTAIRMQELVSWTIDACSKLRYHPLLVIANFVIEFLAIHPFTDGNGRLSRILTTFFMLKQGYEYVPYLSHEMFIEERKSEYYIALRQSQKTFGTDHEDMRPWLMFFLGILRAQAEGTIGLLSSEPLEMILSPNQRAVWMYLNTVADASPREIALHAHVARPTVSQAVDKLVKLGKVGKIGRGSATRYRVIWRAGYVKR